MTGGGRKRVFAGLEFRYSGIERRRRRRNGSESYRIAGIDVHKRMLAVVVIDAARENEFEFERRKFGTTVGELGLLAEWLGHQEVREVVMESTAQYWKPVWRNDSACRHRPNPIARPRVDAERLVRRHVAGELILSFAPGPEQRLWRTMTRTNHQLGRDRVRIHNQMEAFLEDARILSSCLSDLLGVSGKRILQALAEGEQDAARLAALAAPGVHATPEQLSDALSAAATLSATHRQILWPVSGTVALN